jgi:hypothetical protein
MFAQENAFDRVQRSGFDFLMVDLDTALALARIASHARNDPERRDRTRHIARYAYESVLRLREKLHLTEDRTAELDDKLLKLRSALEDLGEVFVPAGS